MIAKLTGRVSGTMRNPVIIDVGGVGYAVHVPQSFLKTLGDGQTVSASIHTHVREDMLMLFGFATDTELSVFELLLTVSGIGPKTALNIMDQGAASVEKAIATADVDFFASIPRLGKKNAQKIIIELRNKMIDGTFNLIQDSDETSQLIDALTSMGFDRKEVRSVIKNLNNESTLEQKIKKALQLLGK